MITTRFSNVFDEETFKELVQYFKNKKYRSLLREEGTHMYYCEIPEEYQKVLTKTLETHFQKEVEILHTFGRINTSKHDTVFRIHADGKVRGVQPTVAALFYLETSDNSGTAFYKHELKGDKAIEGEYAIFSEDDGKWSMTEKHYEEANSMLVYDSLLFHARFPWVSRGTNTKNGRIVLVNFLKTI